MNRILVLSLFFLSYCAAAYAQIGPGSQCTSSVPCFVTVTGGGGGSSTANQGTQAASAAGSTWFVQEYLGGSAIGLTNAMPVQPGTGATFPISALSLPLPTGASTDASLTDVQSAPGTPQTTAVTVQGNVSGIPVPVSISASSGNQAISYASPLTTISVTTSSTTILAAATYTKSLTLCTEIADAGNVWLNLNNGAAVVNSGMYIPAGGGCINLAPPTGAITGISDSGTSHATIQGG